MEPSETTPAGRRDAASDPGGGVTPRGACRDRVLAFGVSLLCFAVIGALASGGDRRTFALCLSLGVMTGVVVAFAAVEGPERVHAHGPLSVFSTEEQGPELRIVCPGCSSESWATTSRLSERLHVLFLVPVLRKTTLIVVCTACRASFTTRVKLERLAGCGPEDAGRALRPWTRIA